MLLIFAFGTLTVGLALGLAFRAFVLLPTSAVVAILALGACLLQNHGMSTALLEAAAMVAVGQVGYVVGHALRQCALGVRFRVTSCAHHRVGEQAHPSRVARRR